MVTLREERRAQESMSKRKHARSKADLLLVPLQPPASA